jgi:peptidoglycan/LPS O-acetylase OafA/YrhL
VAVLLVMGSHLTWHPLLSRFGWTGVDLFFCLSGFLISGLLFRDYKMSGTIHWQRFLLRRGFKIYPAYYVLLLTTIVLNNANFDPRQWQPVRWATLWPDLIFINDYKAGTWGHLWSLGVEEQFYLLLPFCLWAMARRRTHDPFDRLPWICAFVGAACLTMRAVSFYAVTPFNHYTHMRPFHLRCDALFFGVLLSYLTQFRPEQIERLFYCKGRFLLTASIGCIMPALFLDQQQPFMYVPGLTLLYLGYGGILLYCLRCPIGDGRLGRCMSRIGRASYSVYLWHLPVAFLALILLQDRLHWGRNLVFATYVAASIAIGMGMAEAVENPALKLRERLFPERAASPQVKTDDRKFFPAAPLLMG